MIQLFLLIITNCIIIISFYLFTSTGRLDGRQFVYTNDAVARVTIPINKFTFYYEAFLDYRSNPPKLRVYSMNPCLSKKDNSLNVVVHFQNSTSTKSIKLSGDSTEGECPWHWDKYCKYNSYIFTSSFVSNPFDPEFLSITNHNVTLKVRKVYEKKRKRDGMTVCVQPVYWYTQPHNILLFVEAWRAQGATHFIVYYHSSTFDVWKVLKYYRDLGIIRILSWPSFGSETIDSSTYRIGHTLAQNLCIMEMTTGLGVITDFDEIIIATNMTIYNYVQPIFKRRHNGKKVGAMVFAHKFMKFEPSIVDMDYSGVTRPTFYDRSGPSKLIFNTTLVNVLLTHSIRSFHQNAVSKNVDSKIAALLHYRFNDELKNDTQLHRNFTIFGHYHRFHLSNLHTTIKTIFGDQTPIYNSTYIETLNKCINRLKSDKKCRSSVTNCKSDMEQLIEWNYDKTHGIFV